MTFRLGKRSLKELEGVHPDLIKVVQTAIGLSPIDFGIFDGIRTEAEQREFVNTGVSQTMNSKHLPQSDGYGHAVDLVPYIAGRYRWEEEPLCTITQTVRFAARKVGVRLRWGGAWVDLLRTTEDPQVLIDQYRARRAAEGRRPFVDAPHFELAV